jgi:hypothetical protein
VNYVGNGFVNRNHEVGGGGYALSGEKDVSTTVFDYSHITAMVVQATYMYFTNRYPLSPHLHFSTILFMNVEYVVIPPTMQATAINITIITTAQSVHISCVYVVSKSEELQRHW